MSQQQQQQQQPQQPLKLRNPTPYHLLASAGFSTQHPLSDAHQQPHQLGSFQFHSNKESPQRNSIDLSDTFSQHIMNSISSPLSNDFDDQLDKRGSSSSTTIVRKQKKKNSKIETS